MASTSPRTYKGSCHCKKFEFEFQQPEVTTATKCNCSICSQRAYVYIIFESADFKWTSGSHDELTKYTFGKKQWKHEFCPMCGCALVVTGDTVTKMLVNLRSVEEVDISTLKIEEYDGKSIPLTD